MKKYVLILAVVMVAGLGAQERVALTAPVFVQAGVTNFRVGSLYLNRMGSEIRATFNESDPVTGAFIGGGHVLTCVYTDTTADTLLIQLNKVNLTTTSLEKRILQQCQGDGKLGAGSIVGVPQ